MIVQLHRQPWLQLGQPLKNSQPGITRGLKAAGDENQSGLVGARLKLRPFKAACHRVLCRLVKAKAIPRDESGNALLEFSLSVWMLLLVVFLIFEFCMTVYTYSVLGDAAREGVRYAVVHGTDNASCSGPSSGCGDTTGSNVTSVVNGYAAVSFHDISGMTVTPSWPDGSSTPSSRVVVTITYPYVPYLQVPGFNAPAMKVVAEGRIVF